MATRTMKLRTFGLLAAMSAATGSFACSLIAGGNQCETTADCPLASQCDTNTGFCIALATTDGGLLDGATGDGSVSGDDAGDAGVDAPPALPLPPGDQCDQGGSPPGPSASPTIRANIPADAGADGGGYRTTLVDEKFTVDTAKFQEYQQNYTLGSTCAPAAGPERSYLVYGVTGGQQLTAKLTPKGGFEGAVNIVPSQQNAQGALICSQTLTCTIGAGTTGSATHLAVSTGEQPLWVIVSSKDATPKGSYDLSLNNALAISGDSDSCATAKLQPSDGTFGSLTLNGFNNHYGDDTTRRVVDGGAPCRGFAGPDLAYRITTPILAGQGLRAKVTPQAGLDLTVTIVEGSVSACDSSEERCRRVANSGGAGVDETATYTNTSASAKAVFVIVDSPDPAATGTFTLQLTSVD
jgi:hypothetical protein